MDEVRVFVCDCTYTVLIVVQTVDRAVCQVDLTDEYDDYDEDNDLPIRVCVVTMCETTLRLYRYVEGSFDVMFRLVG